MSHDYYKRSASIQGIVLDFDGVILDSNELKADTFRRAFNDFPKHGEEIFQLHMARGGMGRDLKIRTIFKDILHIPATEDEIRRRSIEVGRLIDHGIMNSPFVPGAWEFISNYCERYQLFIASGTPQDEMRYIVQRRNLGSFFRQVFGSPRDKGEILRDLMDQEQWTASQLLFVGDAIDDLEGAVTAGVDFIGLVLPGNVDPFEDKKILAKVESLKDLGLQWNTLVENKRLR